jgi:hypothetical protein
MEEIKGGEAVKSEAEKKRRGNDTLYRNTPMTVTLI